MDNINNIENITKRRRGRPKKKEKEKLEKSSVKKVEEKVDIIKKNKISGINEELLLHLNITMNDIQKYSKFDLTVTNDFKDDTTEYDMSDIVPCNNTDKSNIMPNPIFVSNDIINTNSSSSSDDYDYDNYNKKLVDIIKEKDIVISSLKDKICELESVVNKNIPNMNNSLMKMDVDIISLVDGKSVLLEKTDVACWWCTYNFNTCPCFIPEKYTQSEIHIFGCFCSFNCAIAYNMNINDYKVWDRHSLIKTVWRKYINNSKDITGDITTAPNRECLTKFGGIIDINCYRTATITNHQNFMLIMPPMKSILPYIEENVKIAPMASANTTKKYVLERSKPLPNINNNSFF